MSVELDAGIQFELTLGEQAKSDFSDLLDRQWKKHFKTPYRVFQSQTTDANGNIGTGTNPTPPLLVCQCPTGFTFYITSLIQWADGKTPATVYSAAGAYWVYFHGTTYNPSNIIDMGPDTVGGTALPFRRPYPQAGDPTIMSDDFLAFIFAGTAAIANTNITVIASGLLEYNG